MAMKNQKRLSVTRLLTPVALAVTLAACSTAPSTPTNVDITLDPNQSMQTYLMRADSSEGSIQSDWLIMALKAAIESNDITQAELLIKRLGRQNLTQLQQAEWQLARADVLMKQEKYEEALSKLNFKPSWNLADEQWKDYYQTRAKLLTQQGQYFEAARELTKSSEYVDQAEQEVIAQGVWTNLNQYSQYQITQFSAEPNEAILDLSLIHI